MQTSKLVCEGKQLVQGVNMQDAVDLTNSPLTLNLPLNFKQSVARNEDFLKFHSRK